MSDSRCSDEQHDFITREAKLSKGEPGSIKVRETCTRCGVERFMKYTGVEIISAELANERLGPIQASVTIAGTAIEAESIKFAYGPMQSEYEDKPCTACGGKGYIAWTIDHSCGETRQVKADCLACKGSGFLPIPK